MVFHVIEKAKIKIYLLIIIIASGVCSVDAGTAEKITIVAVGDIMMGTTYPMDLLPPRDGEGIFDNVKSQLRGNDIVFGNLEGPLTENEDQSKCEEESENCYAFRSPPRYVAYLKNAGFNVLNIANNHTADFGEQGVSDTLQTVNSVGIQTTGGEHVALFIRQGKRVAVVGFSYMPRSAFSYPINTIERASIIISDLKRSNDIVIVSFHGGAEGNVALHIEDREEEFLGEQRGNVVRFAHAVIDAGADLVLGHGPHVLRAMEIYRNKLIAYSLGNFLVYERFNIEGESGISMVLKANLDPETGNFRNGKITPVRIIGSGIPVIDKDKKAIKLVKALTDSDIKSSMIQIAESGHLQGAAGKKETVAYKHKQEQSIP